MKTDNFRLVAAGGLPDVMAQIKLWQDGVRFPTTPAPGIAPPSAPANEAEAWDRLIRDAPRNSHHIWGRGWYCACDKCWSKTGI